jgi:hypothetical protein
VRGLLAAALLFMPVTAAGQIQLSPVVSGLSSPVFVGNAGDGSNRLFIVEQGGIIKVLQPGSSTPTVFLNITPSVLSGGERGLLGLAFHPQYTTNRRFFVFIRSRQTACYEAGELYVVNLGGTVSRIVGSGPDLPRHADEVSTALPLSSPGDRASILISPGCLDACTIAMQRPLNALRVSAPAVEKQLDAGKIRVTPHVDLLPYSSTITSKPPFTMRLTSKGMAFGSMSAARRGSFMTFAFTRSLWARDL